MLLQNLDVAFSINAAFTDVTHAMGNNIPPSPIPSQMLDFERCTDNLDGPFHL